MNTEGKRADINAEHPAGDGANLDCGTMSDTQIGVVGLEGLRDVEGTIRDQC
jgi:hypothetical protein